MESGKNVEVDFLENKNFVGNDVVKDVASDVVASSVGVVVVVVKTECCGRSTFSSFCLSKCK